MIKGIAIVLGILLIGGFLAYIIVPTSNQDNTYFINSGGGGGSGSGVSSLTSANSAINLNASSGSVLITPKLQLLAQNTTIGGSSSSTTVLVNQASGTDGGLVCSSSGNNGCAEKIVAGSVLIGQSFNKMTFGVKKSLSPTGTATFGVMNSAKSFLMTCGTLDISTLTTSYVVHSFTCPVTYTLSANEYIGMSTPTQAGGANVLVGSTNPNQFDTTLSFASQWITGSAAWVDATTWDLGSSSSNAAWKLERVGSIFMKADFTAKKHLLVTAELRINGSSGLVIRLNNDTGVNYAVRTDISGTTTALTSQSYCNVINSATITSGDRPLLIAWINNNQASDRKMLVGDLVTGADSAATTAPTNIDFSCKWSNTANRVTNITILGSMTTNSTLTVWGYD